MEARLLPLDLLKDDKPWQFVLAAAASLSSDKLYVSLRSAQLIFPPPPKTLLSVLI